MALEVGSNLGPYKIVAPLGAGGMGEVYRAKDSRLDREVAIKVLPESMTRDPERVARFEREAKLLASLNHPNIAAIYGFETINSSRAAGFSLREASQGEAGFSPREASQGKAGFSPREASQAEDATTPASSRRLKPAAQGLHFLVMEYIEGETLAQRIAKGPLPIDEVLRFGIEIASALDTAHRAGVIHRDLKPANIMLTKSGAKLLDFGLAKHAPSESALSSAPDAPTLTDPLTEKGTIVGTFQYMAPEQLEGKDADTRTDVFAFGAVLYEMTTGQRAFTGKSRASLIASIMSSQPRAISEHQPMTPPALEHLVRSCLAKDPDDRIQTAHDVALQLRWIGEEGSQLGVPAVTVVNRRGRERMAWTLAIMGGVLSVMLGVWVLRSMNQEATSYRMSVIPTEGTILISTGESAGPVALSPDGRRMAFVARAGEGRQQIWIRSLDKFDAAPLAGTEGARRLFWSPDGRKLGFFSDKKLKTIDAAGGPALSLANAPVSRGGTWNRDGTIIFAPTWNAGLMRVSASGGTVQMVTELDEASEERTHRYPYFLPDGRHFLYLARRAGTGAGTDPAIILASLDSTEKRKILTTASSVAYASGHILFARQQTLMAVKFDVEQLAIVGEAFPIADNLLVDERFSLAIFSVSQNGIVAYQTGEASLLSQLTWIDRSGKQIGIVGKPENYVNLSSPELSPDETRVLFSIQNLETGLGDVWIRDLARDMQVRFTFGKLDYADADSSGTIWSPDGSHVVYGRQSGRSTDLIQKTASGAGAAETLLGVPDSFTQPRSYSPDGNLILYQSLSVETGSDLWILPLGEGGEAQPFANSKADEAFGQFSPDGKFVAFVSDVSGRSEVYVASFPGRQGEWQVSTQGGTEPRWRKDGRELYFFDRENWLNATEVQSMESRFDIGVTKKLFQTRGGEVSWRYDVASDGERFLVTVPTADETASPIHVVVNWLAQRGNR